MGNVGNKIKLISLLLIVTSAGQAKINRIYEPILVSQTMTVSPHRVCHDGLFLYFNSPEDCENAEISSFNCSKNYHIAPIRSAEEIHLVSDPSASITRFYHIELQYRYQEVDTSNNVILIDEPRTVSACEDREIYLTENVTKRRSVETLEEKILVASLVEQARRSQDESFLLLNTPVGNVDQSETLNFEDLWESELKLKHAMVRTPFCSDLGADQVWSLSGEYTGSGVRSLMPASLHLISRPLYIKEKKYVVDEESGELEARYVFSCENSILEL